MKLSSSDFNGIYADMYEYLGEEIVRKINKHYKGQQITFPMRLFSKEYVIRYISERYNGKNIKELARELGYSERWIKQLIDNNKLYEGDKET
jgi:Mor family transcriptional regulator